MSGEATAAEINAAREVTVEGSGDAIPGDDESQESLFGETIPTIEEEDSEEEIESSDVKPAPSQPSDDDPKEDESDEGDAGEGKEEETEGEEGDQQDDDKPDKEDVPDELAKITEHKNNLEKALAEERGKNRSLQFMLDQAKAQPAPQDAPKKPPEFKVLTKEEFAELKEDDAVAALQYMHDLADHKEAVAAYDRAQADAKQAESSRNAIISESLEQISTAVPGVYDNEEVGQALTSFAVEQGFSGEDLSVLSNPATMVIPHGSTTPVPLGQAAVAFVKFCNDQMKGSDTTALEKEITERVTKEVTGDLMKKFKSDPASVAASLDDVPASQSGAPEKWEFKTEDQLRAMSEEDRDKYFAGIPV